MAILHSEFTVELLSMLDDGLITWSTFNSIMRLTRTGVLSEGARYVLAEPDKYDGELRCEIIQYKEV